MRRRFKYSCFKLRETVSGHVQRIFSAKIIMEIIEMFEVTQSAWFSFNARASIYDQLHQKDRMLS